MKVTGNDTNPEKQISIATRCRSVDEFVAMAARYTDGNSLFVATLAARRVGLDLVFVAMLADGTPVLRGRAVVRQAWPTADNPFRLPGLLLGIRTLTVRSKEVFDRVRAAVARAKTQRRVTQLPGVTKSEPTFDAAAAFGPVETTLIGPPDKGPTEASPSAASLILPVGRRRTRAHHPDAGIAPLTVVIQDVAKPLSSSPPLVPPADAPVSEADTSDGTVAEPMSAANSTRRWQRPPCVPMMSDPQSCVPQVTPQARGVTRGKRLERWALALLPMAAAAFAILQDHGEAALTFPVVAATGVMQRVSDVDPPIREKPIQGVPSRMTVEIDRKPYMIEVMVIPMTGSGELATRAP